MELDSDKLLEHALMDGLREGVKARLTATYNNPLDAIITAAFQQKGGGIQTLISDSIKACMDDDGFRKAIAEEARSLLAKTLIRKLGGEMEKAVNALKSDPATRARITLAIDEIVAGKPAT